MRTEHSDPHLQGLPKTVVSFLYTSVGLTRPLGVSSRLFVLGVVLMLLGGLGGTTATAQTDGGRYSYDARVQEEGPRHAPGRGAGDGGVKLPSWAEPERKAQGERRRERFRTNNNPGGFSGGGSREVPLGGLEWLILAGAGYGLFKLREDA